MALIKCPHCGKPISDRAVKCPQCGFPVEKTKLTTSTETEKPSNEEQQGGSTPTEGQSDYFFIKVIISVVLVIALIFIILVSFGSRTTNPDRYTDVDSAGVAIDEDTTAVDTEKAETQEEEKMPKESATLGNTFKFEFVVGGTTYNISFNKEEKTSQLYVEGEYAPNGKTFYGSCEYDGLYREGQIQVNGFSGADDFNIHFKDEEIRWEYGAWIDYKDNYLYITQDAARAMNPDYRIVLTPVK
jgi:hypothetical protein